MDQSRLTPDIMAALMRRRAGGVSGGNTAPAAMQTMNVNPMGGPMGPSQTPLQSPPQAMPSGNVQMPQMPMPGQQQGQPQQGAKPQQPQYDEETRNLTKALVQRLLKTL